MGKIVKLFLFISIALNTECWLSVLDLLIVGWRESIACLKLLRFSYRLNILLRLLHSSLSWRVPICYSGLCNSLEWIRCIIYVVVILGRCCSHRVLLMVRASVVIVLITIEWWESCTSDTELASSRLVKAIVVLWLVQASKSSVDFMLTFYI